jgi:hypothetical protein
MAVGLIALFPMGMVQVADAQQPGKTFEGLQSSLTGYIQPAYLRLELSATVLRNATQMLCDTPNADNLATTRHEFSSLIASWAFIEWFRVGPVMRDNNLERMLFYPDRKGTGLKQVRAALTKRDQTVTTVATLSRRSVALQGLGALEFLLYGAGHGSLVDGGDDFRCRYLRAAAENLQTIAVHLRQQWGNEKLGTRTWLAPGLGNPWFRGDREAATLILGTVIHGLEEVKDGRLRAFLRTSADRDRPARAIYRRSANTMLSITENLVGLKSLFDASAVEAGLPAELARLAAAVRFELDQAIETSRSLRLPIEEMLADSGPREKLVYLKLTIDHAIDKLDDDFLSAMDMQSGFSFGDGD